MSVRRGKAQGKDVPEDTSKGTPKNAQAGEKPKTDSGAATSAWSKPREATAPRSPTHMSSSSTNGLAKAKAQSKTSVNIAALAARNLGGFVPNKIFVGGVPIQSTEEQFKTYFERFGGISKVELHALRGFGYITYETVESVDSCLEKYEEHYLCKKWVEVKRSIPRELIDSYEREQKRLEAEFKGEDHDEMGTAPSVKVETPSNATSSPPVWGMPPAGRPSLPEPAVRSRGKGSASGAGANAPEEPGGSAMTSQIQQLTEMGFSEEVARRVFRECAWDFNKALDRLLSSMGTEDAIGGDDSAAAEDPPLSAALSPIASPSAVEANEGLGSPQARAKVAPAWGKPAGAPAWGKPAQASPPDSVWGVPKPAASAWGKQASPVPPPSAKAPPGTPKSAMKASPGTPKAFVDVAAALPPAQVPPSSPVPSMPVPPAPGKGGGYPSLPVAMAESLAEGDASTQPIENRTPPATPPPAKHSSSAPPPPAALPPSAAGAGVLSSPGGSQSIHNSSIPKAGSEEARIPPSESTPLPPTSQPPPPQGEVPTEPDNSKTVISIGELDPALSSQEDGTSTDINGSVGNKVGIMPMDSDSKPGHLDAANVADSAPVGSHTNTPPRKRVQRMKREWVAEDPSQLHAAEHDFVQVWIDTGTEHGWIHAEKDGQVGWLPVCVLQQLSDNRRWMKTKQAWQAMGESQCNVEDGHYVIVWIDSRTAQGWTYIEGSEDSTATPGWLPDFCLEWMDD